MPLPGNKAATPFKTMDIKTALLSAGSRKRKAPSPQICKKDAKNPKLSFEKDDNESDVEILDEVCGITVTLDKSACEKSLGDCKENKDLNASKTLLEISPEVCKENKNVNSTTKEELSPTVKKTSLATKLASPLSPHMNSDKDIEQSISEKSKSSENSSCDELDSSTLNNSINNSLNTSGISITGDEKEVSTNSKIIEADKDAENSQVKRKKMTPADAKKRSEERDQKLKEKLLKKQELEKKKKERLLEKEQKLKERIIQKEREELERKERERIKQEKKEQEEKERLQKQKEKEEKLKLKNMMLEAKLEEKKRKEEMKRQREEELKKAEDEKLKAKLEKEQKEQEKKERAKAAFLKFFVSGDNHTSTPASQVTEKEGVFKPFQVSGDMILAPVVPPAAQERFDKKQLDHCLEFQNDEELYLQILKSGSYKDVRQRKRNKKKFKSSDAEVIVIDQNAQAELRLSAKLLQFCENVRPPYWGTWRKKSKNIRPRNPFGEDKIFDYTVDSDDEWDEGGPGESLSGTENEDESDDDYEVDNEFFVPHGYLSDEEEKKEDDDDEEVNDPEKQKALLKRKLQEFEMERKKKTAELKPIILGCYFTNDPNFHDSNLKKFLEQYSAEFHTDTPIPTRFTITASDPSNTESPKVLNGNSSKRKKSLPENAFPQLIRLVYGNTKNRRILAEEFQRYWNEQSAESSEIKQVPIELPSTTETDPSKDVMTDSGHLSLRQLYSAIRTIASYGKSPEPTFKKYCWWVHGNIREKYGLMDAPIPNQWNYISQKIEEKQSTEVKGNSSTSIKEFLSPT